MRGWVWVVLVGCSSPDTVPRDAPTTPDAFADGDGDGIADVVDLCPGLASPDNGDQDSDLKGDPCDPCPHLSANTDADGDGVGDACDPHPTQPIDRRAAFYAFYNSASIAGWGQTNTSGGIWTVSTGKLRVNALSGTATILSPDIFGADVTVTALIDVTSLSTSQTVHRTAGIRVQRNLPTVMFHKCVLDQIATTAVVNYQIVNMAGTGGSATTNYANPVVANSHDYRLGFSAMTGTCGVDGPTNTFNQASGAPAPSQVGFSVELASVAVEYMFVVESN